MVNAVSMSGFRKCSKCMPEVSDLGQLPVPNLKAPRNLTVAFTI
jgi:hypothetical protein